MILLEAEKKKETGSRPHHEVHETRDKGRLVRGRILAVGQGATSGIQCRLYPVATGNREAGNLWTPMGPNMPLDLAELVYLRSVTLPGSSRTAVRGVPGKREGFSAHEARQVLGANAIFI